MTAGDGSPIVDADADVVLGVSGADDDGGVRVDYSPPPFDVRRVEWEDERVFGLQPLRQPIPSGHLTKRMLLQQLAQSRSLDATCATIGHLLDACSPGLTTSNYTQMILTLYAQAGLGSKRLQSPSDADASAEVADLCCSLMDTARRRRWLLPTRAYNCALSLLCTLDDARCHELHRLMTQLDDLILTEQSYAPYVAYLHRHRRYRELLRVWKDWTARFELQRARWDVSVGQLLKEWILDDDKQSEVASLATHLPCQQVSLFNAALHAANQLRQTHTATRLLQQMAEWRWRHAQLTAQPATPAALSSAGPEWREERLFDHVGYLPLMREPRWTASTFFHLLTLAVRRGAWTQMQLTLGSMQRAHLLHPLHHSTLSLLLQLAVTTRRWSDVRVLVDYLDRSGDSGMELGPLLRLALRLSRAASGEAVSSPAHRQVSRLLLHCSRRLQQQRLLSILPPATHSGAVTVVVQLHSLALHSRSSQATLLDPLHSALLAAFVAAAQPPLQREQRTQLALSPPPSHAQRRQGQSTATSRAPPASPLALFSCLSMCCAVCCSELRVGVRPRGGCADGSVLPSPAWGARDRHAGRRGAEGAGQWEQRARLGQFVDATACPSLQR